MHGAITVEHLLTHSSGLPAWQPFYKQTTGYRNVLGLRRRDTAGSGTGDALPLQRPRLHAARRAGDACGRRSRSPPWSAMRVFGPLGMLNTIRNPTTRLRPRIVPTESDRRDGGR